MKLRNKNKNIRTQCQETNISIEYSMQMDTLCCVPRILSQMMRDCRRRESRSRASASSSALDVNSEAYRNCFFGNWRQKYILNLDSTTKISIQPWKKMQFDIPPVSALRGQLVPFRHKQLSSTARPSGCRGARPRRSHQGVRRQKQFSQD